MNIIAFDTSSDAAVIALETEKTYEERIICGAFSPSENLLHEMECIEWKMPIIRSGIVQTMPRKRSLAISDEHSIDFAVGELPSR